MTLNIAMVMSLDASGVIAGAKAGNTAIASVGQQAQAAAGQASGALQSLAAKYDPVVAGAERYRRALAEIGELEQAGILSAERLTRARATAMWSSRAVAYDDATRFTRAGAAAQTMVAQQTIVPDRGGDVQAYGQALDDLRARYSPLYAAQRAYREELSAIRDAERVGAVSAAEAAAARARTKAGFAAEVVSIREATAALSGHTGALKLSAAQSQNLSYQVNDVVQGLMLGMSPVQIAMQQGPQIVQAFGGVRSAMAAVGALITPTAVGFAAIAAAGVLVAKAGWDYSTSMKEAQLATIGLGRNVGVTAAGIDQMAQRLASSAGLSVSATRDIAIQLTQTGKLGVDAFDGLIGVSKDFAKVLGVDTSEAAAELASILADPAAGAQKLAESYGLVDRATERLVQRLVAQGRILEAQKTLTEALGQSIGDASEQTSGWARAWEAVTTWASNAYDAIGRMAAGSGVSSMNSDALKETIAGLEKGLRTATPNSDYARDVQVQIEDLKKKLAEVEKREKEAGDRQQKSDADRALAAGIQTAQASPNAIIREDLRQQQLRDELERLQAGAGKPGATAQEDAQIAIAIEAKTRALETWISESDRAAQLAQTDVALAGARDPIERAQLEAQRVRIQLMGQEVTETEAAAAAKQAYTRSLGQELAATETSIRDMEAETAARQRINDLVAAGALSIDDANAALQVETQVRQLLAAAARAEGDEKQRLLDLAEGLRAASEASTSAARRSQALGDIRSGEDDLERLRVELSLVGQSEATRRRVLELLSAEQRIRQLGIETGSTEAQQLRQQAALRADMTAQLEREQAAWAEVTKAGEGFIDVLTDGLADGEFSFDGFLKSMKKQLLELTIGNPLKNLLFGENLPTATDVWDRLSGKKAAAGAGTASQSVASMAVTAGTVMINGQLAGVGASAFAPAGAANGNAIGLLDTRASADGVKAMLDLIGRAEGTDRGRGYNETLGYGKFTGGPVNLTGMTLDQIDALQSRMLADPANTFNSSAVGRYQITRTTMRGLREQLGLDGSELYDPAMQDRMATSLLNRRGGNLAGLRQEWVGLQGIDDQTLKQTVDGFRAAADGARTLATGTETASRSIAQVGPASQQVSQGLGLVASPVQEVGRAAGDARTAVEQLGNASTTAAGALQRAGASGGPLDLAKVAAGTAGGAGGAGAQAAAGAAEQKVAGIGALFGKLESGLAGIIDQFLPGFGNILSTLLTGIMNGSGGVGGGLFSSIFSFFTGGTGINMAAADYGFGMGLYDVGGFTGPGGRHEPAGIVHKGEVVWSQDDVARWGGVHVVESIRRGFKGYASGGVVAMGAALNNGAIGDKRRQNDFGNPAFALTMPIYNNSKAEVRQIEEDDGQGGRRSAIVIDEAVAEALSTPGSRSGRALTSGFRTRREVVAR